MAYMKLIAALTLLGMVGAAYADPCADPPKKTARRQRPRPPARKPEPPKPASLPCDCKGEKGDPGERGPAGAAGKDGESTLILAERILPIREPAIRLSAGLMGTVQAPRGDWAWGPALQLATDLDERYELAVSAGLAIGADDGRESGSMIELKVTRSEGPYGLFAGLHYTSIDGSPDNRQLDGSYLAGTIGVSYTRGRYRLAAGSTVGGLRDDFKLGTQFAIGAQGSLFVRFGR